MMSRKKKMKPGGGGFRGTQEKWARYSKPDQRQAQTENRQAQLKKKKASTGNPNQPQNQPTIPFVAGDSVLLVGEGDFSFAHAFLKHHSGRFQTLCATCFDSREELLEKYPQAEEYIETLLTPSKVADGEGSGEDSAEDDKNEDNYALDPEEDDAPQPAVKSVKPTCEVHYNIDASKLHKNKLIKRRKWSRIVFNFPHVGGKSTDVNRQVRYNQALLHDFFNCAKELLSPNGTILVTIFEGEPYTLWNVRDLGRSAGLKVVRSFKFDASVYPGYKHARTLGNLRAKAKHAKLKAADGESEKEADGEDPGDDEEEWGGFSGDEANPLVHEDEHNQKADANLKRPGRWRGEERPARTFEFGLADAETGRRLKREENGEDSFTTFTKKRKRTGGKSQAGDGSSDEDN